MSPFDMLAFTVVHIEKSSSSTTKSGHSADSVTLSPSQMKPPPVMVGGGTTDTINDVSRVQLFEVWCRVNVVVSSGCAVML